MLVRRDKHRLEVEPAQHPGTYRRGRVLVPLQAPRRRLRPRSAPRRRPPAGRRGVGANGYDDAADLREALLPHGVLHHDRDASQRRPARVANVARAARGSPRRRRRTFPPARRAYGGQLLEAACEGVAGASEGTVEVEPVQLSLALRRHPVGRPPAPSRYPAARARRGALSAISGRRPPAASPATATLGEEPPSTAAGRRAPRPAAPRRRSARGRRTRRCPAPGKASPRQPVDRMSSPGRYGREPATSDPVRGARCACRRRQARPGATRIERKGGGTRRARPAPRAPSPGRGASSRQRSRKLQRPRASRLPRHGHEAGVKTIR